MRTVISIVLLLGACDDASMRVFTTSTVYSGTIGGLTEADAKCADTAKAAGLGGTFIALLSDSSTNAIDRIEDVGPWQLVSGETAFATRADIATMPLVPLGVDEKGRTLSQGCAWTGSKVEAKLAPELCMNWAVGDNSTTGRSGNIAVGDQRWIEGATDCGAVACNVKHHLYCFEQ